MSSPPSWTGLHHIDSLTALAHYGVILHFPAVKHYVVLDRIEDGAAWMVDLTSRKFYWKRPVRELLADWNEGVALLVSDSPILVSGQIQFLDADQQKQIFGSSDVGYDYSHCINHPTQPGWCEITGRWYSRYIRACQ